MTSVPTFKYSCHHVGLLLAAVIAFLMEHEPCLPTPPPYPPEDPLLGLLLSGVPRPLLSGDNDLNRLFLFDRSPRPILSSSPGTGVPLPSTLLYPAYPNAELPAAPLPKTEVLVNLAVSLLILLNCLSLSPSRFSISSLLLLGGKGPYFTIN